MSRSKKVNKVTKKISTDTTCKPGCGVCGKDKHTRKRRMREVREEGKKLIKEELT